ncbi:MAG: DUF4346 domain-containing protein [Nanoarchaeota archaeon]
MTKLKIVFDKDRCIGNFACVAADPAHWEKDGEKAVLKGGENNTLVVEAEDSTADMIIAGAEVCPVNAIKVIDTESGKEIVGAAVKTDHAEVIEAVYDDEKEFILDPEGYFLIRIIPERNEIEVGFCTMKNEVKLKVIGKKPIDIYHTILTKQKLAIRPDHAAYLGRELQKAYLCLRLGKDYIQDDEITL